MQIKWVDDLLAVAQTKNFSRAADLRCVTQSALSRRIRSLEDWAGVELVDRSTYPVQLTAAGQTFCDQGREALAALIELRTSLRQDDTMSGRFVRIMASHTLSITFLPELLDRFQQTHAELNARVLSANIHDAAVALTEGRCDLMLTYSHPQAPILLDPDRFTYLSLGAICSCQCARLMHAGGLALLFRGIRRFLYPSSVTRQEPFSGVWRRSQSRASGSAFTSSADMRPTWRCI